jgi:class 3 adenylate cyclase/tetratricopeptide (TPR) repeat protein
MDIASWLRGLGLAQYEKAFRDNDIEADVLGRLTSEDLRELGVASIGHRRRLLDAIAALAVGRAQSPSPASAASAPDPAPQPGAERRQLTVMFCDLVGSTALSTRFDPEDLREIIAAYHRAVAETVARYAGYVAKYMGDGVLVYFGYPQAHEDDAERAVRAGLAAFDTISRLDAPERLQARIGVAPGLAVVGDLVGEGAAQERGVVGETPNLAARLQALAGPSGLVISDSTRRQIGTLFAIEELGPQSLAGFAESQPAWRVLGESGVISRFEALRSGATPLVGRGEEVDLLSRRWQQAQAAEGRVILISGEPGIGKSRLTESVFVAIEEEPHIRLRWFCSPHHQDSALYPIIVQIERAAGITRDDTAEQSLGKLRAVVDVESADDFELLAELLSLPNSAATLNLSAPRKREKLFMALLRQLEMLTRQRPVVAAFEDVHWIDPTSRELLDLMIDRVRRLPVMLMVTYRPEFQASWAGQPHVTTLALNRLDDREVETLVRGLAGNMPLGGEVVAEIAERTDGVPLFVEELTKAVLERGDQEDRVAGVLSGSPVAALAVPATLHASLISRLDRIGPAARETAQVGAVLGREFGYELIERVAQRPAAELQAVLGQLSDAGLLFCRGAPPHSSYLFKHALVQDVAYGTMLRIRRQELHARVAEVLERDFADLAERQPELLAHHLQAARNNQRAVEQWLKAGQRAAQRLAYVEAIAHLERGLGLLASLPKSAERDDQEIDLRLALGVPYITVRGMASDPVRDTYRMARELAERRGDMRQLFQATYGLWQNAAGSGQHDAARLLAEGLLQVAGRGDDDGQHLQAHHSNWTTFWLGGDPARALAHCEEGSRLYDIERHRSHRHLYGGHDPGVCARMTGSAVTWLLGYPSKALTVVNEARALAERIAHPFSYEVSLEYSALVHALRGEPAAALAHLATSDALRTEQRVAFSLNPAFLRAGADIAANEPERAIESVRDSLAPGQMSTFWMPYGLCLLAEALNRLGRHAEALATLARAFERVAATGERCWDPELHRMNGLVLLAEGRGEEAQASLRHALYVARQQQAKSLELRAAMDLARLLGERGRREEARQLLAGLYGWFTEGFDTVDLNEAKTLIDALA